MSRPGTASKSPANAEVPIDNIDPDSNVRERVVKEIGLTSNSFIGPIFPPPRATANSNIEDTLIEFYKELEQIEAPSDANVDSGTQEETVLLPTPSPKTLTRRPTQDVNQQSLTSKSAEKDCSGQKQTSWPHWYQNEPYSPKRQRLCADQTSGIAISSQIQMSHPQPLQRPPYPRLHTPVFHRPPPPHAFSNPHNQPPPVNPHWESPAKENHYQEENNFQRSSHPSSSPHVHNDPYTESYHDDFSHNLDRDYRNQSHDSYPDVGNEWLRDGEERWSQFEKDYDWRQRFVSGNELWEQQHHCRPPENAHLRGSSSSLTLILMRGLPGSGKSTLARELVSSGPSGLILSTDDYFACDGGYRYDPGLLAAAHEWNQNRANDAMVDQLSPIIIDNTNIQAWEMKPYVKMALDRGYRVDFCEPDTSWKFDPFELEKRNKHGVPHEKIAQMLDRFSFPISVDVVMTSQEPCHVTQRLRPQPPPSQTRSRDRHF